MKLMDQSEQMRRLNQMEKFIQSQPDPSSQHSHIAVFSYIYLATVYCVHRKPLHNGSDNANATRNGLHLYRFAYKQTERAHEKITNMYSFLSSIGDRVACVTCVGCREFKSRLN